MAHLLSHFSMLGRGRAGIDVVQRAMGPRLREDDGLEGGGLDNANFSARL